MKWLLLVPVLGQLLEKKYLEEGIYPYNSSEEEWKYADIRLFITIFIVLGTWVMITL